MIYFLDNSLQLQKIVTSKNINSAIHEHELNGLIRGDIELDLSYANKFLILGIDHVGYYYKDEFYLHKIQRVEYDHVNETALVVLRHVFFEDMIFGKLIQDVRPQNQDALFVLRQTIDANTRWQTVMTDVTGRLSTNFYWQVPYEVIEFVTENYRVEYIPKILFDGQKINGFQLHVANKVGEDKNIRIPFGSRVLDLKYEEDYSEIITKLVGHGKGEEVGDGYGRRINIADVNFSKNGVESPLGDVYMEDETVTATYGNDGQTPREGRVIFEDIENVNKLAQATYEHYLQVSRPQMLFTADVAAIGDVGIGDSVMIIRREYDVYFKARIHKMTVDLLYPEDAQVELGDYEHFKESKISRKSREKNNRLHKRNQSLIEQAKRDFDERFNSAVEQFRSEFEQAKIDIFAEIEADRENMQNLLDTKSAEWTENFNQSVAEYEDLAERKAEEKASAVQTNLDSFKDSHQQLYDEVTGNILDIDTFLGDKSKTLKQQFDKVRKDFGTLQTDLNGVESDLTATKTDLQKQLDEARAELDGLEVGGRNLFKNTEQQFDWDISDPSVAEAKRNTGITIASQSALDIINSSNKIVLSFMLKAENLEFVQSNQWLGLEFRINFEDGSYSFIRGNHKNFPNIEPGTYDWKQYHNVIEIGKLISEKGRVISYTSSATILMRGSTGKVSIKNYMLTSGSRPTDHEPAPEDTEEKITTLNQQIEFIDGQLSAKLEQTDLLPINNKITEYGNSLTVNAQSIESLISKTELHDGDITKWSNQTTANAENITTALSRISNTESGLTKAQTDIIANADGLSAVVNRVNKTETGIESLTTDFNIEAGKVETLITKTDGHASQLTNIVANYDSIQTTIANMEDDVLRGFASVDMRFDSITNTVANIKLNTRNMLRGTTFEDPSLLVLYGDSYIRVGGEDDYVGHVRMGPAAGFNTTSIKFKNLVTFRANEDYYLTLEHRTLAVRELDYLQLEKEDGTWTPVLNADTGKQGFTNLEYGTLDWHQNTIRINFPEKISGRLRIGTRFDEGNTTRGWIDIFRPYLTNTLNREWVPHAQDGQNIDEVVDRVSEIEQLAESIRLDVQSVTNSALTQADITVSSNRVMIGSQSIGSETLASIISVSPSAIDLISDKINVTGNVNIKGGVTSLAIDAIEGNFARLFTKQLTANVITSDHIQVGTALVNKLFATSARIDELITKNHFVTNVTAMTVNAVEGQFSTLFTRYLNANYIDVDYIVGKNAWFESLYTQNAMIRKLTAQTAFIRDIQTIEITANQLNIATLHSKLRGVEGGLTIYGPDGRVLINNSMLRASFDVQVYDAYGGNNVEFAGLNYYTSSSFWQTFKYFYTDFKGSQLLVSWAVGLQSGNSASEYAEVQVRGFGGNNPIGSRSSRQFVKPGETTYHNQIINLGVPDYSTIQGYLEFRRSPTGVSMNNTVYARVLRVSLIN